MAGVNEVTLVGHCGRDPEARSLPNGDKVVQFSLATSETWKDKTTGERKEQTEWHRIVIFNQALATIVEDYVRKGSLLHVRGTLKSRKFTDKDGIERTSTEVVLDRIHGRLTLLGSKPDSDSGSAPRAQPSQRSAGADPRPATSGRGHGWDNKNTDLDDDLPF